MLVMGIARLGRCEVNELSWVGSGECNVEFRAEGDSLAWRCSVRWTSRLCDLDYLSTLTVVLASCTHDVRSPTVHRRCHEHRRQCESLRSPSLCEALSERLGSESRRVLVPITLSRSIARIMQDTSSKDRGGEWACVSRAMPSSRSRTFTHFAFSFPFCFSSSKNDKQHALLLDYWPLRVGVHA